MKVAHLVEPMGGLTHLWGKEEVIRQLMLQQRQDFSDAPLLISFSDSFLCSELRNDGFQVEIVGLPKFSIFSNARRIKQICGNHRIEVLHTHGYKANIVGRVVRTSTTNAPALVSTSHGFDYYSRRLRIYNLIDIMTAKFSDAVTVTAPNMARRFPFYSRPQYVPNGLPNLDRDYSEDRLAMRQKLGIKPDEIAVGTLGRLYPHKGVDDVLAAAHIGAKGSDQRIVWVIAGTGPMESALMAAVGTLGNVRFAGFVENADSYLSALDVYVQASHREGLSMALLQAIRAGLPVVATMVGATDQAVIAGENGVAIPVGSPSALLAAVTELCADRPRILAMGCRSRLFFQQYFSISEQSRHFSERYARSARAAQPLNFA